MGKVFPIAKTSFKTKKNQKLTKSDSIIVELKVAESAGDIIKCQYLVAMAYNRYYKVFFSKDKYDLAAKIEPYPHRFVMAMVDGELAGVSGLYIRNTYIEKFGKVSEDDILSVFDKQNITRDDIDLETKYEITKVVCTPKWLGYGLGAFLWGSANSKAFLYSAFKDKPFPMVMACAKLSAFDYFERNTGIVTQKLKDFPVYKIHEFYSSSDDPMESRIIVSERDVPDFWYHLDLNGIYEIRKNNVTDKLEAEQLK